MIDQLKKADLRGRGGAGFPTAVKWQMVKDQPASMKYIIANGSEGEPGVFKDSYILANYPAKLVKGLKLAMKTVGAQEAYIYLRSDLYAKHKARLQKLAANKRIKVWREDGSYLCGEETTLLNSIEGLRDEPRLKPPFPTQKGLFGFPTVINNIETLYTACLVAEGKYKNTRLYSVSGQVKKPGVYELPVDSTLAEVLKQSGNLPTRDYFAMIRGGACGAIATKAEAKKTVVAGAGAVVVYDADYDPMKIMKQWTKFFLARSCGKCVPCREGFFRLNELLSQKRVDYQQVVEMLEVMAQTAFCGLGQYAPNSYLTLIRKVIKPT